MANIDFSSGRLVVTGDVMLDRYWFGDVSRISPEAPVPVLAVQQIRNLPGGAANVAVNSANLGGRCTLLSVTGDDEDGATLHRLVSDAGVSAYFLKDHSVPTTVKLRLVARQQQVVRADFEGRPNHEALLPLVDKFKENVSSNSVSIFSDYAKGGLKHLDVMMRHASLVGSPVLIDPKGRDYTAYRGATVLTPNMDEFLSAAGSCCDEDDFERKAFALRENLNICALLVTRSEEGMSLFFGARHIRIPSLAREVFDVSGAGDTVIAVLGAGLSAGLTIEDSARLANIAAGVVVGKSGTAPITLEELRLQLRS